MISNKDLRVEDGNIIINGEKHPLDPAIEALTKRANIVQGKLSALDTRLDAIEALEKTASGNPISLTGVAAAYAMGLSMTIEPIQSGSGDPSPTNVRPISGLTSGDVQTTNGTDTNTATITFGQTVYGGSVNFKTGEVTVTHEMVDLGSLTWDVWSTYGFRSYDLNNVIKIVENTMPLNAILSEAIVLSWAQYANNTEQTLKLAMYKDANATFIIAGRDMGYADAAAFKAAMSGVQLCYELETPTTLTLTPAELELLKGANTISGNGVTINIDYIGR